MASSQVAALGGKAMRHAALPLLQRGLVKSLLPHVVALPVRRVSQRGLHGRAASLGVAKQRGTAVYQVNAKYAMEAHPDKKPSKDGHKGEDAQFIRESDSWVVCGIADGVGGWGSMGIDAGLYARRLMEHASAACTVDELRQQPQLLLEDAHDKVNADRLMGSCTACIAVFENGLLRVVNLGDSGAIGVRPSAAQPFLRTEEQQHYFNCPYQLGSDNSDRATQGQLKECAVQHNDIIVLGTDGFFDNLFDADITRYIRRFVEQLEARSYLPTMEAIAAAAAASDRPSSAPQAQRAGLHTSANDLAASLSAPRAQTPPLPSLSPSSCAASASASLHTRAFPTAPAGEPAGPIEQVALAFPPLSTSSAAATLADASSSPSSVASHTLSSESLQRLADELVREALHKAHGKAPTPFSEAARRARKKFNGGKLDDITIVIAQIVDRGGSGAATGVSAAEAPSTTAAMFGHSVSASAKL